MRSLAWPAMQHRPKALLCDNLTSVTQRRQFKQCCSLFYKQPNTPVEFHGSFGHAVG